MICIIPARGGSKRLPGKNLRKLDGEFIINWVIKTAQDIDNADDWEMLKLKWKYYKGR